jgi:hypothetical protein
MFSFRPLAVCLVLAFSSFRAPAQHGVPFPRQSTPEIVIDKYADVVKASPTFYRVELENERVRVLHARIPGRIASPPYDERPGLIVAITDVHLLYTTTDGRVLEIQVPAGGTRWIDGDTHSEENLSSRTCEFLFIETKSR